MRHSSRIAVDKSGCFHLQVKYRLDIWPFGYLIYFWQTRHTFESVDRAYEKKAELDEVYKKFPAA